MWRHIYADVSIFIIWRHSMGIYWEMTSDVTKWRHDVRISPKSQKMFVLSISSLCSNMNSFEQLSDKPFGPFIHVSEPLWLATWTIYSKTHSITLVFLFYGWRCPSEHLRISFRTFVHLFSQTLICLSVCLKSN